ncbi:MAG: CDP-alcohol phosphatidyltransferase family protein [Candidatus Woesearchaeota archaeon]
MSFKKFVKQSITNKKELQLLQQVYRFIGFSFVYLIRNTFITPNMITVAGIFVGLVAGLLLYRGHFGYGAIVMQLALFADYFDGALARLTNRFSVLGEWIEGIIADKWVDVFVYAGYGIGIFYRYQEPYILILTAGILVVKLLITSTNDVVYFSDTFKPITKGNQVKFMMFSKKSVLSWFAKQAVPTRTNIYVLLTVGIIFGHKLIFFILVGVYQLLFYFAYVSYFTYRLWRLTAKR